MHFLIYCWHDAEDLASYDLCFPSTKIWNWYDRDSKFLNLARVFLIWGHYIYSDVCGNRQG